MSLEIAQEAEYIGDDRWNWAVWLEGPTAELDQIDTVVWELHPTFPRPLRPVTNRSENFRLESQGWGMFEIVAAAYDPSGVILDRFRDWLVLEHPDAAEAQTRDSLAAVERVYISASLRDAEAATRLRTQLQRRGFEVWDEGVDLITGESWISVIEDGIAASDAVIVVVRDALSPAVESEATAAVAQEKRVVPVVIGEVHLPPFLADRQPIHIKEIDEIEMVSDMLAQRLGA